MQTTTVGFPHFNGGFCDDRHCAGSSAATYDGHWVWKTAEAWVRDHHADGEVCPSPNGCGAPGCRKAIAQGQAGLDGQSLTDDQHRAMHHRADGSCVFDACPLATKPKRERASLNTVWDKTIFKGELLTDVEARAVAELALAVASCRTRVANLPGMSDTGRAAMFDLISEKFEARFVDDFMTDDTDTQVS